MPFPSFFASNPSRTDSIIIVSSLAFIYFSTTFLTRNFHSILDTASIAHPPSPRPPKPEDLIPLSELETLLQSPIYDIRQAAIAVIQARHDRHPATKRRMVRALSSEQSNQAEYQTALRVLLGLPQWRRREIEDALPTQGPPNATSRALEHAAELEQRGQQDRSSRPTDAPRIQISLATDGTGTSAPVAIYEGELSQEILELVLHAAHASAAPDRDTDDLRIGQRMSVEDMADRARRADQAERATRAASPNFALGPVRISLCGREFWARNVHRAHDGQINSFDYCDDDDIPGAAAPDADGDADGERSMARPSRRRHLQALDGSDADADASDDFDGERSSARPRRRRRSSQMAPAPAPAPAQARRFEIMQPLDIDMDAGTEGESSADEGQRRRRRRREAVAIIDDVAAPEWRASGIAEDELADAGRRILRVLDGEDGDAETHAGEDEEVYELQRY